MPHSSLTVLIPWRNRPELQSTLRLNAATFRTTGATLGIINCGGDAATLRTLVAGVDLDLFLIDVAAPFNRSLALNLGAYHASSRLLCMLDADVLIEPGALTALVAAAGAGHRVATVAHMNESASASSRAARQSSYLQDMVRTVSVEFVWHDGVRTTMPLSRESVAGTRAGSGQVVVSREHFMRIGGYNSDIIGWGVEDLDLLVRLRRVCDLEHVQVGEVVHLTHDDAARDLQGETRDQSNQRNFQTIHRNYMRGRFDGTLDVDVATWKASTMFTAQPLRAAARHP